MRTKDFHYDLPPELIAQTPAEKRDASRLLHLDKTSGEITHHLFHMLPALLRAGDCMILNNSRVIPARLLGRRETGGETELLLLRDRGEDVWECLAKPGKKARLGARFQFGDGRLTAEVLEVLENGNRLVRFRYDGIFLEVLEQLGKMPLPPYIRQEPEDAGRYQTVYAKAPGSAAAPTAGLHFTRPLLAKLQSKGVSLGYVTLHVGLGTFRPVKAEELEDHEMHAEYCEIPVETAALINRTKRAGGRVIAVGTTSCRTLESRMGESGVLEPYQGWTNIFIYPGYRFKCVDGLVTNFHLPESTLLMLVSALAGRENILRAYDTAVRERYRFFSFGDAMFIG